MHTILPRQVASLLAIAAVSQNIAASESARTPLRARLPHHEVSIEYLLESCAVIGKTAGGKIPHFDCESYVYGVLDSHLQARPHLPKTLQSCHPPSFAPWQVYELIINEKNLVRTDLAAEAILKVLARRFPCPQAR